MVVICGLMQWSLNFAFFKLRAKFER
jgi:hypothetical protein